MTRLPILASAAVFAGALLASSPARAGSDVGVIVTGEGTLQPQLAAQIESWLSQHGHTLVPSPLPPDAIATLTDCFVLDNQACARDLVDKRSKSSSMVFAKIDIKANPTSGRDITLTVYWFDKGHAAVAERKTCERCVDQTLRTTADEIMKKLVGGGDVGHVKLSSNPPGARIVIDGQAIGVTPLDWDLPPGPHKIQMDKAGLKTVSRDITVASNKSDAVGMVLLPAGAPGSDPASDQPSRLLPITALAAGGALILTGAILIAVDQDPDPKGDRTYRDSAPAGAALLAGGVVVGAIGTYLMWFRSPKASSTPVAAVTGDSAYVGWAGRF
ncbi:MAG TPA: PEGA domain-containing protein [Kofleriaceae bacterium]|nr:PEGA domain-containing protein [Kofleriaceae bacterium]